MRQQRQPSCVTVQGRLREDVVGNPSAAQFAPSSSTRRFDGCQWRLGYSHQFQLPCDFLGLERHGRCDRRAGYALGSQLELAGGVGERLAGRQGTSILRPISAGWRARVRPTGCSSPLLARVCPDFSATLSPNSCHHYGIVAI